MNVITLAVGGMLENCYIVYEGREAVVIDPGNEAKKILRALDEKNLALTHILLTHGHFDHIGAVKELKDKTNAKICIHMEDSEMLNSAKKNLSNMAGMPFDTYSADMYLYDGQIIETGEMHIRVIETPGHTPGGVCFEIGGNLFTGDTLFMQSVGRTDFPGCSTVKLNESLGKLKNLKTNYVVYPGHGPSTMLDDEKRCNPFM